MFKIKNNITAEMVRRVFYKNNKQLTSSCMTKFVVHDAVIFIKQVDFLVGFVLDRNSMGRHLTTSIFWCIFFSTIQLHV